MPDYWASLMTQRIRRRQALAGTAAGAGAAVLLAACGGGSDNKATGQNSGLVTQPSDTTSKAKRGGVWLDSHTSDVQTFDPHTMSIPSSPLNTMTYSRLFKPEVGHLKPALSGSVVGDAVESYEFSPDKLQVTMKLRPNKWHSIAPVNGRAVDAEDIAFTFQRLSAVATHRPTPRAGHVKGAEGAAQRAERSGAP